MAKGRVRAGPGCGAVAAVADEAGTVLGVEEVEDFADQLDTVSAAEPEFLGDANVELGERRHAKIVHVRLSGHRIETIAVAIEIFARPLGIRRPRVVTEDAGKVEAERSVIDGAER